MDTVYDWVTLTIFAGLIVLFLQRATSDHAEKDVSLFYYLVAGVGCAHAGVLAALARREELQRRQTVRCVSAVGVRLPAVRSETLSGPRVRAERSVSPSRSSETMNGASSCVPSSKIVRRFG